MSKSVRSVSHAFATALLIGAMGCAATQPVVQRDDVAITKDVRARFAADASVSPLNVAVDTKAGVVRLTGFVATDGERNSVERIALEAPGVRSVDNSVIFGMGLTPAAPSAH
jgi:osmotically-inducible protein OsmY